MIKQLLLLVIILLTSSCQNIAGAGFGACASYIGALSLHEGGHVAAATINGSNSIEVSFIPGRDRDGHWNLGETTATHTEWTNTQSDIFLAAGPASNLLAHIMFCQLLRGKIAGPRLLNQVIAWLSFGNQAAFYYHCVGGLLRNPSMDLGRINIEYSIVMLCAGLSYDLVGLLYDNIEPYRALVGYGRYATQSIELVATPLSDGASIGLEFRW
jgi:hypothetical protein